MRIVQFASMRVALGADHAGVQLKDAVRSLLQARGVEVHDFGTLDETSVDYPDYAALVARAVAKGDVDRGILACGTGLGMAIAANKIDGVRAAPVVDLERARLSANSQRRQYPRARRAGDDVGDGTADRVDVPRHTLRRWRATSVASTRSRRSSTIAPRSRRF